MKWHDKSISSTEMPGSDMRLRKSGINAADIIFGLHVLRNHEFNKHHMSLREKQVATRMMDGESNNSIAKALFITPSAVKHHVGRIYAKLGVTNREEFSRMIRHGMDRSTYRWRTAKQLRNSTLDFDEKDI